MNEHGKVDIATALSVRCATHPIVFIVRQIMMTSRIAKSVTVYVPPAGQLHSQGTAMNAGRN